MITIKALNEEGSDSSDSQSQSVGITREAQEEGLNQMYSDALKSLSSGDEDSARQILMKLNDHLNSKTINQKVPLVHQLKYLTLKNLGLICKKNSINYLLDALEIDPSDVTIWLKTGNKAAQTGDYLLARNCYEEAHKLSPQNWIAIDRLLDAYFILHDLYSCFLLCCESLDMDSGYRKAQILINEICKLHPPMIKEMKGAKEKYKRLLTDQEDEEYKHVIDLFHQTKMKRRQMFEDERTKQEAKRPKLYLNLDKNVNKTLSIIGEKLYNLHDRIKKAMIFPSTPIEVCFDEGSPTQNDSCESEGGSANTSADEGTNNGTEQKEKEKERKSSSSRNSANFPLEYLDKRRSTRVKSLMKGGDLDERDLAENIFYLLPESIKTPINDESSQEEQEKVEENQKKENEPKETESDVIRKFIERVKQAKIKRKVLRIYDLIEDYLCELSLHKGITIPSIFNQLYLIYREKHELPCAFTLKIDREISIEQIWLVLAANEFKYNKLETMFLTQMIIALEIVLPKQSFYEFAIRLFLLRGIKENDNDSLKYALELLEEPDSVNLEIITASKMTIKPSVVKSILESQSQEIMTQMIQQEKYKDLIKLLKSKPESELTNEEEKLLSEAIINSEQWQDGIDIYSSRNELTNTCLKTIKICLERGKRAKLTYQLTSKLVKLAASNSVLAWACLYWGIISEEHAVNTKCNVCKFLKLGHKYLGKRGICTGQNGEFLLIALQYLIENDNDDNEVLKCFTCLYNFPPKKQSSSTSSSFSNHSASPIKLKWENCELIYNYFTPEELPEFDSLYRLTGISSEIESLLLRIAELVPENLQRIQFKQTILHYIDTGVDFNEDVAHEKHPITDTLYYFLADYYFKNKEFKKACEFYLKDLGINPNRFDSWAGSALSRSSELEQQLISGDNLESGFFLHAAAALRCFERALRLDPQNTKLWIEFGNLAYNISSHSSRTRKTALFMQTTAAAAGTFADHLQAQQEDFLNIAKCCFQSANNTDAPEEVWLPYYMLGKVMERKNILASLKYYEWAELCLYVDGTSYPKKIQYHNPPALAVEALEIHYRIHAATLKYITSGKKCPIKLLRRIKMHLIRALKSPFAKQLTPSSATSAAPVDHDYATGGTNSSNSNGKIYDQVKELMDDMIEMIVEKEDRIDSNRMKSQIITLCLNAMKRCLNRYPAHYKSIYRLADYYFKSNDFQTAKCFLFGGPQTLINPKLAIINNEVEATNESGPSGSQEPNKVSIIPGLFADKKANNLFNGIWRIPVDDIDRPGSFSSHMFRSTFLLIRVCTLTHDYQTLCTIAQQLSRTPEVGKKYLREEDRKMLARFAFESCAVLLKSHFQNPMFIGKEKIVSDVQKIVDRFIKANVFVNDANALLRELYQMMRR